MFRQLCMARFDRTGHQLSMSFTLDELRFKTSYWYSDVDLLKLEQRYGRTFMEKVYFHIMAFEANKLASLRPDSLDLGPFAHLYTPQFETLWRTIFRKVWAQWRYEHALPDYEGPAMIGSSSRPPSPLPVGGKGGPAGRKEKEGTVPSAVQIAHGRIETLCFCGGGKDSLVAMKLLDRAGIPYASYAYSHSLYGRAALQHQLIDRLLDHGSPACRHRQWVYDDFMDSPVVELHREYGIQSLLAAETPSSIFGVLPLVLQHGYRYIALAHERSANVGNLIWDQTGEEVNHQWGKSLEAERLINQYLQRELISNVSYFSILQPVYDVLIFNLLNRDLPAVPHTHSCNIRKPWCCKCPKCAYVWLNYMAYLPTHLVDSIFKMNPDKSPLPGGNFVTLNLFDVEENQVWFRQMLGLEAHTPFECIGQIDEVRLAFELCRRRGLTGRAMDTFRTEVPALNWGAIIDKSLTVNCDAPSIPRSFADGIFPQMLAAAETARKRILEILAH